MTDSTQGDMLIIECIKHQLTGMQMLEALARHWTTSSNTAAILIVRRGRMDAVANSLRVNFSRERKRRDMPRTFELRFAGPLATTMEVDGVVTLTEMVVVNQVDGGKTTQFAAAFSSINPAMELESQGEEG